MRRTAATYTARLAETGLIKAVPASAAATTSVPALHESSASLRQTKGRKPENTGKCTQPWTEKAADTKSKRIILTWSGTVVS